jgi:hypothetical protein
MDQDLNRRRPEYDAGVIRRLLPRLRTRACVHMLSALLTAVIAIISQHYHRLLTLY